MSKPRILVVDDEKELLRSIERILKREDMDVTTATCAEEALLGMQQSAPPDLIISDLMMPGIGGLEMLKLVSRKQPDVPVILITACWRLRLPAKTFWARATHNHHSPRLKSQKTPQRKQEASCSSRSTWTQGRWRNDRRFRDHAQSKRTAQSRRPNRSLRTRHRGIWNRKRSFCASSPHPLHAIEKTIRACRLRCNSRKPHGVRTLWS